VPFALSKGNFDVWKWRRVSLKGRPTGVPVPGEETSGTCDAGCFPELTPRCITWRHSGLRTPDLTHTHTHTINLNSQAHDQPFHDFGRSDQSDPIPLIDG